MSQISQRETANDSSGVLRRESAGEIIEVTNAGVAAAVSVPASMDAYHRLLLAGRIKEPTDRAPFSEIVSAPSTVAVQDDVDALRER